MISYNLVRLVILTSCREYVSVDELVKVPKACFSSFLRVVSNQNKYDIEWNVYEISIF